MKQHFYRQKTLYANVFVIYHFLSRQNTLDRSSDETFCVQRFHGKCHQTSTVCVCYYFPQPRVNTLIPEGFTISLNWTQAWKSSGFSFWERIITITSNSTILPFHHWPDVSAASFQTVLMIWLTTLSASSSSCLGWWGKEIIFQPNQHFVCPKLLEPKRDD